MGNHLSNSPETILPPPSSIMALLFNFKTFVFGLFVYYATYLHYYKCPSLTPIVELEEKILHPLTNQHSTLCELVNGGIDRATPYVNKVHGFLDKNVHSHPLFIEYKIEEYIQCAKNRWTTYVYPVVYQLYQFTDVAEARVYDEVTAIYKQAEEIVHGKLKQD